MTSPPKAPSGAEVLAPCPFCGGDALLQEHPPHDHPISGLPPHPGNWTVECVRCSCGMCHATKAEAVSAWNRRPAGARAWLYEWYPKECGGDQLHSELSYVRIVNRAMTRVPEDATETPLYAALRSAHLAPQAEPVLFVYDFDLERVNEAAKRHELDGVEILGMRNRRPAQPVVALYATPQPAEQSQAPGGLTGEQVVAALRNIGYAVECGACMEVFYTGATMAQHDCDPASSVAAVGAAEQGESGFVLVPRSALDWLFGDGPNADGKWFGEEEDHVDTGRRYWWRSVFRRLIRPQPSPPQAEEESK